MLRRRYSLDATVQNLAADETGRWGGQLRAQLYGLTGLGDVTSLAFYTTANPKEQKILNVGHSFRPGSEGLTIDGQFTYAWTQPDIDAGDNVPDLKSKTLFWSLGGALPDRPPPDIQPVGRDRLRLCRPEGPFLRAAEPRQAARAVAARRLGLRRPDLAPAGMARRREHRIAQGARHLRCQRG